MSSDRTPGWERLLRLGLAVRWTTLREGLRGTGLARGVLTTGDVARWARARLEVDEDAPAEAYELADLSPGRGNDHDSLALVDAALERLAGAEDADPKTEARKWRLLDLVTLIERAAAWPPPDDDDDDPACDLWMACRDIWEAWATIDRPPFFFRADGQTVSCYHGRALADIVASYRAWFDDERAALAAAAAAQPAAPAPANQR